MCVRAQASASAARGNLGAGARHSWCIVARMWKLPLVTVTLVCWSQRCLALLAARPSPTLFVLPVELYLLLVHDKVGQSGSSKKNGVVFGEFRGLVPSFFGIIHKFRTNKPYCVGASGNTVGSGGASVP